VPAPQAGPLSGIENQIGELRTEVSKGFGQLREYQLKNELHQAQQDTRLGSLESWREGRLRDGQMWASRIWGLLCATGASVATWVFGHQHK
jgi:hypothetical protein